MAWSVSGRAGETKALLGVGLEIKVWQIHLSCHGPCVTFFGYYIKNLFLGNSVELFSPGTPSTLLDSPLCPKLLVLGGDSWDLGAGTEGVGLALSLGVSQETHSSLDGAAASSPRDLLLPGEACSLRRTERAALECVLFLITVLEADPIF